MTGEKIEMHVHGIALTPERDFVIMLADRDRRKLLPISVSPFDAEAIVLQLQGAQASRPLTHDLLRSLCISFGADLEKVVIADIKENIFHSTMYLRQEEKPVEIDARPSDAIALALKFSAPIFLERKLIEFTFNAEDFAFYPGPNELH